MQAHKSPLAVALAVTVKQRRAELNMSSQDLADAMGVPPEIVADIEWSMPKDSLYSKGTLMLLSLALRLPENALLKYSHNPSQTSAAPKPTPEPTPEPEPVLVAEQTSEPAPEPEPTTSETTPTPEPPAKRSLLLPPMFARKKPDPEIKPIIENDHDDQQKVYIGLEAIAQDPQTYRPSRSRPKLPKPETPRSPFIPHHGIEQNRNIQFGPPNRAEHLLQSLNSPGGRSSELKQNASADEILSTPETTEEKNFSEANTTAAAAEAAESQETATAVSQSSESRSAEQPVLKRQRYVPALASRLPFSDIQRETGILRIDQMMLNELTQKNLTGSESDSNND